MSGSALSVLASVLVLAALLAAVRARRSESPLLVPTALICVVAALLLVATRFVTADISTERLRQRMVDDHDRRTEVCLEQVGHELARRYPGRSVLVIQGDAEREPLVRAALARGFAGHLTIGAMVQMPSASSQQQWAGRFSDLVRGHGECDLVISLIGVPRGLGIIPLASQSSRQRPPLIAVGGERGEVEKAVRSGLVTLAVMPRQDVAAQERLPRDTQAAFERAFEWLEN